MGTIPVEFVMLEPVFLPWNSQFRHDLVHNSLIRKDNETRETMEVLGDQRKLIGKSLGDSYLNCLQ